MQDIGSITVTASTSTRTDTLAYLAELLGEQERLAESIGESVLAYIIGVAALEAEKRVRHAWGAEAAGKG